MAGLFGEFRRRNIFNVGAAYLTVTSPVPQAAAAAFPGWTVIFVSVRGDGFWQYVGTIEPNVYLQGRRRAMRLGERETRDRCT